MRGIQRSRRGVVALLLLALAFAGCGGDDAVSDPGEDDATSSDGDASSPASATDDEPATETEDGEAIVLGLVAPRSGALADFGEQIHRGAQIAAEEINAEGGVMGRPLQIEWEDDQSTPEGMASAMRTFESDGVDLQFGFTISSACLASTPLGDELGIVMLGVCAADGITGTDRVAQNFFNVSNSTDAYNVATIQQVVAQHPDVDHWSVFGFDYSVGTQQWATTQEALAAQGIDVTVESEIFVPVQQQDYTSQVGAMAREFTADGADQRGLVLSTYGSGTVTFMQQAQQLDLLDQFAVIVTGGNYWSAAEALAGSAPEVWNGYDYWWDAEGNAPRNEAFVDAFREAYDTVPHSWNAEGYESVLAYATAIEAAGDTSASAVASALEEITIDGLNGPYQLDPDTHASNRPVTVSLSVGNPDSPAGIELLRSAIVESEQYTDMSAAVE